MCCILYITRRESEENRRYKVHECVHLLCVQHAPEECERRVDSKRASSVEISLLRYARRWCRGCDVGRDCGVYEFDDGVFGDVCGQFVYVCVSGVRFLWSSVCVSYVVRLSMIGFVCGVCVVCV